MTSFETCLTSGQHYSDVQSANTHATDSGINSTPSFTVNGKIVNAGEVQQAIEDALAQ
jgi:protein-disulfide isomerase